MTDEKLEQAAREFAGGIQIGAYSSQDDKYIGFCAGAKWQAEQDRTQIAKLREVLEQIDKALTIPAAEYVPAISDVFDILDKARKALK